MKNRSGKKKLSSNTSFIKHRWPRYALVLLSVVQAHWPALAVGAAAVTAATLFGDKGNLALSEDIETLVAKGTPGDTVDYLEKKIDEYHQWIKNQSDEDRKFSAALPYLRYQLAKALEAAGAAFDDTVAAYQSVVSLDNVYAIEKYAIPSLIWLYENTSERDYVETIQNNPQGWNDRMRAVAMAFESANHWPAFELFLDSVVSGVDDSLHWANSIDQGFRKNSVWQDNFLKYARSKPMLADYVFQEYEKKAQRYLKQENYRNAVKVYREIIDLSSPNQDKAKYEYKVCQVLFLGGLYEKSIVELDRFINEFESTHRHLTQQAILLKGRSFVHLGRIDRAIDTFLKLMVEYPEAKQAPEANFFMGYSYMLQGKFELATDSLTLVAKDYPQSSYAGKARLCLARIQSMGL